MEERLRAMRSQKGSFHSVNKFLVILESFVFGFIFVLM